MAHFLHAFPGLLLSTGGVLYLKPLFSLFQLFYGKTPILFSAYTSLFMLLNPLNFYLNILLLVGHVTAYASAPGDILPTPVALNKHLLRATRAVSLATLVISAPLSMHVAFSEESVALSTGTVVLSLSLVTLLSSGFNNFFVSRDFNPVLFSLFMISSGLFTFFISDKIHHIPLHLLLLLFLSFMLFTLSITLLILRIGAPTPIHAENSVLAALSVVMSALVVGGYLEMYAAVTGMATVVVKAGDL
jgi:hypothetical protein